LALVVFKDEAQRNRHGSFVLVRLPACPIRHGRRDNGGELFNEASRQLFGVEAIDAARRLCGV